ncbi:MAG: hypothetical protein COB53_04180 [Elusimicrobia bacterium]|nr:MAG: hypothetical protein COB53_04180 [Elusimicrobiota bacterium]
MHDNNKSLLYASGETNAEETAPFESHLPDCSDCLDRVSLAKAVQRATKSTLQAPSQEVLAQAAGLQGGLGGSFLPKWFRLMLTAAAISTAFWGVQKYQNRKQVQEPVAAAAERNSLTMPKKKAPAVADYQLSRVRGRSQQARRGPSYPMPARPLDCQDRGSILAFKRYSWYTFGGGQAHGVYSADRWAACICKNAAAAGRPDPPPTNNASRGVPPCPNFMVGPVAQEKRDRFAASFLQAAKTFHRHLPLSRAQAAKLTRCLCGAIPDVVK